MDETTEYPTMPAWEKRLTRAGCAAFATAMATLLIGIAVTNITAYRLPRAAGAEPANAKTIEVREQPSKTAAGEITITARDWTRLADLVAVDAAQQGGYVARREAEGRHRGRLTVVAPESYGERLARLESPERKIPDAPALERWARNVTEGGAATGIRRPADTEFQMVLRSSTHANRAERDCLLAAMALLALSAALLFPVLGARAARS